MHPKKKQEQVSYMGKTGQNQKDYAIQCTGTGFFFAPQVEWVIYTSIESIIPEQEWKQILLSLNDILKAAFFPIWLWAIMLVSSFGLLSLLIFPIQKSKTKKAAKALEYFVLRKNKEFIAKGKNIRFEIPNPSIERVILKVSIL